MRSFGHTEATAERDAQINRNIMPELDEAWAHFLEKYLDRDYRTFNFAKELLEPIKPTVAELRQFIFLSEKFWHYDIGLFVSAGYALAPEQRIVYDLHTPDISRLGYGLRNKELVITGAIGDNAGQAMIGTFVNEGKIGAYAGHMMVGTFINNGTTRRRPHIQFGVYRHTGGKRISDFSLGNNNGHWNIKEWQRDDFLKDIADTPHMNAYDLQQHLLRTYRRRKR